MPQFVALFQVGQAIGSQSVEFQLLGNKLHPQHAKKCAMAFLQEIFSLTLLHFVNHILQFIAELAVVVCPGTYPVR